MSKLGSVLENLIFGYPSITQVDIYFRPSQVGVHIHDEDATKSVRVIYPELDTALENAIETYENPLKEVPNSASTVIETVIESTQPAQLSLFESNIPPTSSIGSQGEESNPYSVSGKSEIRQEYPSGASVTVPQDLPLQLHEED